MSESSSTRTPTGDPGGRSSSVTTPPEVPISEQPASPAAPEPPASEKPKKRPGDRIFQSLTTGAGIFVVDLLDVTVATSLVALIIAMPVSLGIALFLTQYAPKRLARPVAYVIDLLAAEPSIIFGLWGIL